MQVFTPTEVAKRSGNKYLGVLIAAKYARLLNEFPRTSSDVREKKLTNFRSQGEGVAASLTPATKLSLERSIEYIAADEFVEVTPQNLRLRKRVLKEVDRRKLERAAKKSGD